MTETVEKEGSKQMSGAEWYEVGPGRGRKEIDPTNRTQVYTRIRVNQEDAYVVDHESGLKEVYDQGRLVGRFESALDADAVMQRIVDDHFEASLRGEINE